MRADAVVVLGREPRGFAVHARERARIVGAHEVVDAEARGGVAAARDECGRWGSAQRGGVIIVLVEPRKGACL